MKLGTKLNPRVEMTPAENPIQSGMNGVTNISAEVPIETPPARVAFKTYSAFSFPLCKAIEVNIDAKTEESIPIAVFIAALDFPFPTYNAPLKDGQYIHKKIVPINPNKFE